MLHILDVASYQWDLIKKKSPIITGADGLIVKISEGTNYRNPYAYDTIAGVKERGQCLGVYHYAHAEKNDAVSEADYFLSTVNSLKLDPPVVLALDFEGDSFKNKNMDTWARNFLDRIYILTGVRPLLYVQADMIRKFTSVKEGNYGLWAACWDTTAPPSIYPWSFWALWQYHVQNAKNFGIDQNLFNGDITAWNKYGGL